jgi:hypothetical protein
MARPSRSGEFRPLTPGDPGTGTPDDDDIDFDPAPSLTPLTVEETDAAPSVTPVDTIIFDGATVTNNGDGSVTVVTSGVGAVAYSPVSVTDDDGDHYYLLCDGDGTPVLVEV